VTEVMMDSDSG